MQQLILQTTISRLKIQDISALTPQQLNPFAWSFKSALRNPSFLVMPDPDHHVASISLNFTVWKKKCPPSTPSKNNWNIKLCNACKTLKTMQMKDITETQGDGILQQPIKTYHCKDSGLHECPL